MGIGQAMMWEQKTWEWKMWHRNAGVENTGLANVLDGAAFFTWVFSHPIAICWGAESDIASVDTIKKFIVLTLC